jgi:hypothetical protein
VSHWIALVEEQRRLRIIAVDAGEGATCAYDARIALYERAADAERMEAQDGVARCVCCLKPVGKHTPYWKRQ